MKGDMHIQEFRSNVPLFTLIEELSNRRNLGSKETARENAEPEGWKRLIRI